MLRSKYCQEGDLNGLVQNTNDNHSSFVNTEIFCFPVLQGATY